MVDIKIEGDGVKVLGGGTQAYNKDNTDRRRPLIMKSPVERQKKAKMAKDPIYKDILKEVDGYKEEIASLEEVIDNLEASHDTQLDDRHKIIRELEAQVKSLSDELAEAKVITAKEAKPKPAARVKKKPAVKDSGD